MGKVGPPKKPIEEKAGGWSHGAVSQESPGEDRLPLELGDTGRQGRHGSLGVGDT